MLSGLDSNTTSLRDIQPVVLGKLVLRGRVLFVGVVRLLLLLFVRFELVFLLVEELAVELLAFSLEFVGVIDLLQLHILKVEDVEKDQQLLAVNAQV